MERFTAGQVISFCFLVSKGLVVNKVNFLIKTPMINNRGCLGYIVLKHKIYACPVFLIFSFYPISLFLFIFLWGFARF